MVFANQMIIIRFFLTIHCFYVSLENESLCGVVSQRTCIYQKLSGLLLSLFHG